MQEYGKIRCGCGEEARIVECGAGTYICCPYCGSGTFMCTTKQEAVKKFMEEQDGRDN